MQNTAGPKFNEFLLKMIIALWPSLKKNNNAMKIIFLEKYEGKKRQK